MEENQYVIISKTAIQKRIEELEQVEQELIKSGHRFAVTRGKIDELISLISQSTPLIPVLEDCYENGIGSGKYQQEYGDNAKGSLSKQDYIKNLKLDI